MYQRKSYSERRPRPPPLTKLDETFERLAKPRRPTHFASSSEKENVLDTFGRNSVKVTIGSSRPDREEEPRSPGPSAYNTFDYVVTTPRYTLKSRPEVDYSTATSNADMPNVRVYPQKLEKHIGIRQSTDFWRKSETPAGSLTHRGFGKPKIAIHIRRRERLDDIPGPGAYSPRNEREIKLVTFPKSETHDAFDLRRSFSPGPGKYTINRSLIGNEKWKGQIRPIKVWDYGEND